MCTSAATHKKNEEGRGHPAIPSALNPARLLFQCRIKAQSRV